MTDRTKIETSTKWGRVEVSVPSSMPAEVRGEVLAEMAQFDFAIAHDQVRQVESVD